MLHVVPYRPAHVLALRIQPAQASIAQYLTDDVLDGMRGPHSFTFMDGDESLACVGVTKIWDNRAFLWSIISADIGPRRFLAASLHARRFLDVVPFRRIEAAVEMGFAEGHRWARLMGFKNETPQGMEAFLMDGTDCALYARVKAVR